MEIDRKLLEKQAETLGAFIIRLEEKKFHKRKRGEDTLLLTRQIEHLQGIWHLCHCIVDSNGILPE